MLKILIINPILGLFLNILFKNNNIESISLLNSFISMYITLYIVYMFNYNSIEFQYRDIINIFNNKITLGVDGLSILLLLLVSITIPILIKLKESADKNDNKFIINILFIMQIILYLIFTIIDIFGFFIMFELVLIPLYILLIKYGSSKKNEAALRLIIYSLIGSLLMLIGIIILYIKYGTTNTELLIISLYNENYIIIIFIIFILIILSFIIKIPSIPFHTWLPEAHSESPTIGSIILAGIILKLGTYGILRFINTFFINIKDYYSTIIISIAIISIIYSSLSTIRQIDIKKIIAYSSIVHMNYRLIGMISNEIESIEGSIYLMISHALISSNLFMLIGMLYKRYHKRLLFYYKGLVISMPLFSSFFLLNILGNISLPGLASFISEILIIIGTIKYNLYVTLFISFSIIFSTAYSIWLLNRLIYGQLSPYILKYKDISFNEFINILPFFIICYIFRFIP